jgi:DEAD/DEAH box helicase domain-containing protein
VAGSAWYPYDKEDNYSDSVRYNWQMKTGLPEIKKEDWCDFWRRYNILQLFDNKPKNMDTEKVATYPTVDLDEILLYFPGLEDVVKELVSNQVRFDTDGGYQLTDEEGIIIAEAAIKIEGKNIVIDDFSGREDDVAKFESHGYKVIDCNSFNINEVK